MTIAYCIRANHDDSYMLGEDTYKPQDPAGFYDWRFGKNGFPHPATCKTCGRKTDPNYVNPEYKVKKRKRDITTTYDGYTIVSEKFKDMCLETDAQGAEFIDLPSDKDFFWLRTNRIVEFDAELRATRFEKYCNDCNSYFNVIGATPIYLKDIQEPLSKGFYRTNLEFGSGHEQHPLILAGVETFNRMQINKFQGLEFYAVKSTVQ